MAAVFDGTVVTRPLTNHVLPGTTRTLLLELCDDLDVPVDEAPIPTDDLRAADELMLMGTTTGIMPVVRVDDWGVGDGTPGPLTRKLQDAFRALEPA
jgi:D-alanine transaminase